MTSTINYDLLNQDKAKNEGIELANKHLNMVKEALKEVKLEVVKKVSDLTVPEFKTLMVECFEMLKQRELDTSMKEYERVCRGDVPLKSE